MRRLTFDNLLIIATIAVVFVAVLEGLPLTIGVILMLIIMLVLAAEAVLGIGFGEISLRSLIATAVIVGGVIGLSYFFAPERTAAAGQWVMYVATHYGRHIGR